jgi:hypothetical protein
VGCRLARRVPAARDEYVLTLRQWRFAYAGTVIHACAAEPLLVGQIKPPVLDSSRADRGACDDFGSIRKVTHAFGWRKLRTHTFATEQDVDLELLRLFARALGKLGAGNTLGESEVVLDPGGACGLSSDSPSLDENGP